MPNTVPAAAKGLPASPLVKRCYDAVALLRVCQTAAISLHDNHSPDTADALARSLGLLGNLMDLIHDEIELAQAGVA